MSAALEEWVQHCRGNQINQGTEIEGLLVYTAWFKKMETDSLFAQIGDSNDKCSSSLEVECWNKDEMHAAQQSPTQF